MTKKHMVSAIIVFVIFNIFSRIILPYYPLGDIMWHNILAAVWFLLLGYIHVAIVKTGSKLVYFLPFYWIVELWRVIYITYIQYYFIIKFLSSLHNILTPLWGGDYLLSLYNYYIEPYFFHVPALIFLHHIIRFFISILCIIFFTKYCIHFKKQNG